MKFRKRPIVIEAAQWFPDAMVEGVCIEYEETVDGNGVFGRVPVPFVRTLEGKMFVNSGDWIITGVKGERYPCKPDIFEATYEPVD